jgi:hypothetical protein
VISLGIKPEGFRLVAQCLSQVHYCVLPESPYCPCFVPRPNFINCGNLQLCYIPSPQFVNCGNLQLCYIPCPQFVNCGNLQLCYVPRPHFINCGNLQLCYVPRPYFDNCGNLQLYYVLCSHFAQSSALLETGRSNGESVFNRHVRGT